MSVESTLGGFKLTDKIESAQIIENNELKPIMETCEVIME
jgi:hypothetical protein